MLATTAFYESGRRDLTRPAQTVKRSEAAQRPQLNPRPPEPHASG